MTLFLLAYGQSVFALEPTYFKGEVKDVPLREQSIIIGENGFYPNKISVFKGEKVRFFITSTQKEKSCFNIPDKEIFTSPARGEIIEKEVFFEKSGSFVVNCPNMMYSGRITVLENRADQIESNRRGLASDLVQVWRPKDTPTEWSDPSFKDESYLKQNDHELKDFPRYRLMEFNRRSLAQEGNQ